MYRCPAGYLQANATFSVLAVVGNVLFAGFVVLSEAGHMGGNQNAVADFGFVDGKRGEQMGELVICHRVLASVSKNGWCP